MELVMENVVEYTEYMLCEYYHLNTEPFFSALDTDVMWIGPGNLFVFGETAVKSYFKDGFIMPYIEMENIEFYLLQSGKDSGIVVGRFSCHTEQGADKVAAANQRVTIHFRQYSENKSVKITHMHVSNEWNELVDDEVFPFKVSVQTYRYVQKLVTESGVKRRHKKIELRNDTGLQYIDPNMVVYAEAIGKYTVVHFVDKIVTIKRLIGKVALLFPEIFCRPHRGYLVNCEFIDSVERYRITMVTGTMIPIPEKRYFKVREEIATIMQKI
nr:LytTR family transcriptional regulator [Clostridioides difficile]